MKLEAIHRSSLKRSDLVMQRLTDAMANGQIKAGDVLLSERELADMLGVGRPVIRESLAILEFLGIIEKQKNRKVVASNPEQLAEILRTIQTQTKY